MSDSVRVADSDASRSAADRDPDRGGGDGATADGDPFPNRFVPGIGTVFSAVAAAALLVPVRRGADDPTVWVAAALAIVATGTFLARRHDLLERHVAGPIAALSSFLVVLFSGYAITQGVLGSTLLPVLEWSISLLFTAFFVAAGALGIAVADYVGVSPRGLFQRASHVSEMVVLAFVGLFSMEFVVLFLAVPTMLVVGELSSLQATVLNYVSVAVALGLVSIGYLRLRDRDLSYIDLEVPTVRTVGWLVGGFLLLMGANVGFSSLMTAVGVEGSEHSSVQQVMDNPDLLIVIVPAMVLVVGPFEELLYRNVIQKSLYETFSRYGAIVVASVVFTAVHVSAYATAGANQILSSLAMLFVLSLILGTIYERTENLLVPALIHGCYNAAVFLMVPF